MAIGCRSSRPALGTGDDDGSRRAPRRPAGHDRGELLPGALPDQARRRTRLGRAAARRTAPSSDERLSDGDRRPRRGGRCSGRARRRRRRSARRPRRRPGPPAGSRDDQRAAASCEGGLQQQEDQRPARRAATPRTRRSASCVGASSPTSSAWYSSGNCTARQPARARRSATAPWPRPRDVGGDVDEPGDASRSITRGRGGDPHVGDVAEADVAAAVGPVDEQVLRRR